MNPKLKGQLGFNLPELMIVIAVIALLIRLSGYAWQVMILRANQTAAISHLSKITTAQAYYASKIKGRFASQFRDLVSANLPAKEFDADHPVIDGYRYTLATNDKALRS